MLVLTRGLGDEITITIPPADRQQVVTVRVAEFKIGRVRLGITAEREVQIQRDDLKEQPCCRE